MKRSEINKALKEMENMIRDYRFSLPPFCNFTPEEWREKGHDYDEVRDNMLGWDITDYGLGDFDKVGFSLITIRNGNLKMKDKYTKSYAEKLLYLKEGQYSPMHFHWNKMEDIINRGGGTLKLTLYNADENEGFADTSVEVTVDGKNIIIPAGGEIFLKPGQSVTLKPYQYHQWQGVEGTGDIALFEVSTTNDDTKDNRFYKAQARIPNVEEDEELKYLMFKDYKDYITY